MSNSNAPSGRSTLTVRTFGSAAKGAKPQSNKPRVERATREEMDAAFRVMNTDRRPEALDIFDKLIEKYPKDRFPLVHAASTALYHGRDLGKAGDDDGENDFLRQSVSYALAGLRINGTDTKLHAMCANAYKRLKMFEKADAFYERALTLNPKDHKTLTDAAFTHYQWAKSLDCTEQHHYDDLIQMSADLFEAARIIAPEDQTINEMLEKLAERDIVPIEGGWDLDDPAYDLIQGGDPDLDDEPTPETPTFIRRPDGPNTPTR